MAAIAAAAVVLVLSSCSSDSVALPAGSTGPPSTETTATTDVADTAGTTDVDDPTATTSDVDDPTAATSDVDDDTGPATSTAAPASSDESAATRALFAGVAGGDPGCSVAVSRNGRMAFAEAYGSASLDPAVPMTPDTVVDIGSVAKQFTATAIALLAGRGTVDLDEPLMVYVPSLPEWASEVTIRQMLHHTSGIPDYVDLLVDSGIDYSDPSTDADALNALAKAPDLDFEPGTSWEYSNSNYFLLGQVVLEVTGDSLGSYLASTVFGPLSLDAVMDPTAEIDGMATSYEQVDGEWVVADSPWEQTGDGGIRTTPTQVVSWAAQYWDPTIGDDDINSLRLDDAVDTDVDGEKYGFGIIESAFEGERVLQHSGAWAGFASSFVVAPDQQLAVAVTCTSEETFPDSDNGDIAVDILVLWLPK